MSALSGFGALQLSPFVLALLAKGTLLLLFASVLNLALRRASASARHMVWLLTLTTLLALPLLTTLLPRWDLPVLPRAVTAQPARVESELAPAPPRSVLAMPATTSMPSLSNDVPPAFSRPPQDRVQYVPNQPSSLTWQSWLVAIWIAGVVLGLLRFVAGTVNVWNATRHAQRIEDDLWLAQLDEAARGQSLQRDVVLRRTRALSVPVVWGWRRPVVLVPVDSDAWSGDRRRAILQHELAHVARYDCVAQTIAAVTQALYWPHPLVWWAVRQLRREAERACDDRVLVAGTDAPQYAEYLLDAARRLRAAPWLSASTSAVVERTHLGDRLLALLDDGLTRTAVSRRTVALATLSALGAAAAVAALQPSVRAVALDALRAAAAPVASPPPSPGSPTPRPVQVAEPLALTGTVKSPDGKPVAGALVDAWQREDPFAPTLGTIRTDAKGEFRMPVPNRAARTLRVRLVPFAPYTIERVIPGAPLVVTLTQGSFVAGIVRDAATQQPIAGARVTPALGWSTEEGMSGPSASTDPSGRFRLEGLAPGSNQIEAVAVGFGSSLSLVRAGRNDIQLFLTPGTEITGVVTDSRGRPVKGALASADDGTGLSTRSAPASDEQGRFIVSGLDPGSYRVVVKHAAFAPAFQSSVVVDLGAPARVSVRLEPPVRVVGRLIDADEKPVGGRVLLQAFRGVDVPMSMAAQVAVVAGADGRFALDGVPRGALTLGIKPRGHLPTVAEVTIPPGQALVDIGDIRLDSGLTLRGIVRDRKGMPVANANVSTRQESREATGTSESDGTFALSGLPDGARRVRISAEGFAPVELDGEPGGPAIKVVLDVEAVVAGTVVDESGRGVDTFRALVHADGPQRSGMLTATPEGEDGRFRIAGVPAGTYALEIQAARFADKSLPGLRVNAGQSVDVGRIVLSAGGTVRGTVVDSSGAPIPGANVSLEDSRGIFRQSWSGGEERQGTSDNDGRFEVRGLPYGLVPLKATHPLFAPSASVEVQVPTGANAAAETRFTLLTGGRIEGTALTRDGQPFAGFVAAFPSWARSQVHADGKFAMDHVPPGHVTVNLMAGAAGTFDGVVSKEIQVRDGETATVDFRVRDVLVSGTVTRGGAPVAQQEVRVLPSHGAQVVMGMSALAVPASVGPQRLKGVSATDGTYALLAPQPGRYTVSVKSLSEPSGRSSGAPVPDLDVPDADSVRFDIALPGSLLVGSVVERPSGRPIAEARVNAVLPGGAPTGGRTATGADGRFRLALNAGTYDVRVEAPKFAALATNVVIGDETLERTFELARGAIVKGQVVATGGQGVGGATVAAIAGGRTIARGDSLPGGAFELSVLSDEPYQLFAAHERGFGLVPAPTAAEPARLKLDPGTMVSFHFRDRDGAPVAETLVRFDLVKWNGVDVGAAQWGPYGYAVATNTEGVLDIMLPHGEVELATWAQARKLRGNVRLTLGGSPLSLDVTLERQD